MRKSGEMNDLIIEHAEDGEGVEGPASKMRQDVDIFEGKNICNICRVHSIGMSTITTTSVHITSYFIIM